MNLRVRLGRFLLPGTLFLCVPAFAAPVQAPEPLPVILVGAGNWLDRTAATQRADVILPDEGQPMVLTNTWTSGVKLLASEPQFCGGLLFLSNVWTYVSKGLSEEEFWRAHGMTNSPLRLTVPGESRYCLFIANGRVLPFVGRSGSPAPDAIWALPMLPVKVNGTRQRIADISKCGGVDFDNDTVHIHGWIGGSFGIRQAWNLSVKRGLLSLELLLQVERNY